MLNTKLLPVADLTSEVTIDSKYQEDATSEVLANVDQAKLDKQKAREADLAFDDVQLPKSSTSDPVLVYPGDVDGKLASIAAGKTMEQAKIELVKMKGIADYTATLVLRVYNSMHGRAGQPVGELDLDGSGTKRAPTVSERKTISTGFGIIRDS